MYCGACGNELSTDARFCAVCGQPVGETVGAPSAVGADAFAATPVPGEPWKRGGPPPWAQSAPPPGPGVRPVPGPASPPMMQPAPPAPPMGSAPVPGTFPPAVGPYAGSFQQPGYGYGAPAAMKVKKRSILLRMVKLVAAFVVLTFLAGVGYGIYRAVLGDDPPAALGNYMQGKGVVYPVPRGVLTVRLPEQPELEAHNVTVASRTLKGQISDVKRDTYEVGIGMLDAPTSGPAALHNAMAAEGARFDMDTKSIKDTTLAGQPAAEGVGRFEGDQVAIAVTIVRAKMYLLIVHTRSGARAVLHEFESSVHVSGR